MELNELNVLVTGASRGIGKRIAEAFASSGANVVLNASRESEHFSRTLEEFREAFGRPAQATLLYHYARLIELVYGCERTIELLEWDGITDTDVRATVNPGAGRGVGVVEAPRGTLIHDYTTDANGCIESANLIVGTTHNIGPMNMSVKQAATSLIRDGAYDQGILNKVEMAVRAYDP